MNKFTQLHHHIVPASLVGLSLALYGWLFTSYYVELGNGIASLAIVPVIVAGWFFGIRGGIVVSILCIFENVFPHGLAGDSILDLFSDLSTYVRMLSLFLVAIATGVLRLQNSRSIPRMEKFSLR